MGLNKVWTSQYGEDEDQRSRRSKIKGARSFYHPNSNTKLWGSAIKDHDKDDDANVDQNDDGKIVGEW